MLKMMSRSHSSLVRCLFVWRLGVVGAFLLAPRESLKLRRAARRCVFGRARRLGPLGAGVDLNEGLDAALVAAVGGGLGMAKLGHRRTHVSKYAEAKALDPWDEAVRRADEAQNQVNETVVRRAAKDPFAIGASELEKRGPSSRLSAPLLGLTTSSRAQSLDYSDVDILLWAPRADLLPLFLPNNAPLGGLKRKQITGAADGRDPATFGFVEVGVVVGSHGVRGMVRVDSESDFGAERFTSAGIRHMKLPTRRSPRPILLEEGRRLKVLGVKTRYIVRIAGVETREAAASLAGATLFVVDEDRAPETEEDYYLYDDLIGAAVLDADSQRRLGTVVDVIDPPTKGGGHETVSLGHSHLEIELEDRPRYRCLIPLAPPIVDDIDLDFAVVQLRPPEGLLDLAYEHIAPPPFIRGLLAPPQSSDSQDSTAGTSSPTSGTSDDFGQS